MINIALAKQIHDMLTLYPEKHDQGNWVNAAYEKADADEGCGTTGCIAGWATILGFNLKPKIMSRRIDNEEYVVYYEPPNGKDWEVAGAEALGLKEETAGWVFSSLKEETALAALRDLYDGMSEEEVVSKFKLRLYGESYTSPDCPCDQCYEEAHAE